MLHAADSFTASERLAALPESLVTQLDKSETTQSRAGDTNALPSGGRYGEQRKLSFSALALTVFIHLAVIGALLGIRNHVARHEEARLITVNLSPPPPAAAKPPTETPRKPDITVPRPRVQIDLPQQMNVPVAIEPQPPQPSAEPVQETSTSTGTDAPPSIVQGDDLGARMISGKPPRYPIESRRKREEGTVQLSLILGTDGSVEKISVFHSSGYSRLDSAALEAVRRWRWEPVVRNGSPVKVKGIVEIPFQLQG